MILGCLGLLISISQVPRSRVAHSKAFEYPVLHVSSTPWVPRSCRRSTVSRNRFLLGSESIQEVESPMQEFWLPEHLSVCAALGPLVIMRHQVMSKIRMDAPGNLNRLVFPAPSIAPVTRVDDRVVHGS